MNRLSEKEIDIVRKYYQVHSNDIPPNRNLIPAFLDSLSSYRRADHYDNQKLVTTVSLLVDRYYDFRHKTISDEEIAKRKVEMINWIKAARDNQRRPPFSHYISADLLDQSLSDFYFDIFNNYYERIGCAWVNR